MKSREGRSLGPEAILSAVNQAVWEAAIQSDMMLLVRDAIYQLSVKEV
jgi:hypothetical protein